MNTDLSWLCGQTVEAVRADPHSWVFTFSRGGSLRAECPWRIVSGGAVALGSADHQQKFGLPERVDAARKALSVLAARQITDANIHPETSDLVVGFLAGVRLELFNGSSGYEGWTLRSPEGREFIAQGGGHLVVM